MADFLSTAINDRLYVGGRLCLNSLTNTLILLKGSPSTGLTIGSGLKSVIDNGGANSISLVGGYTSKSSGITLNSSRVVLWSPHGTIRGFTSATGSEIFKIDENGRYLCLGTTIEKDCGSTLTNRTDKIRYYIADKPTTDVSTTSSISYKTANSGQSLNTSDHSVYSAVEINRSYYTISPLPGGLLMISGTWTINERNKIKENTWFKIALPYSMTVYGVSVSDVDGLSTSTGNIWIVGTESIGANKTAIYVGKDTGKNINSTLGFSFMALASLTNQSNITNLFN